MTTASLLIVQIHATLNVQYSRTASFVRNQDLNLFLSVKLQGELFFSNFIFYNVKNTWALSQTKLKSKNSGLSERSQTQKNTCCMIPFT